MLEQTDLLMAAMEAVCYAEGMFSGERIGKLAKGMLDAEQKDCCQSAINAHQRLRTRPVTGCIGWCMSCGETRRG